MTTLTTILATQADTVSAETVLALIQPDTPERTATRLRALASDHPDGVPVELLDLEGTGLRNMRLWWRRGC